MDQTDRPKQITPPNAIAPKLGAKQSVGLDTLLANADAEIEKLSSSYVDWVSEDVARLKDTLAKAEQDVARREEHVRAVYTIVHDMKGQGGTFGYTLVTQIGRSLCHFLDHAQPMDDRDFQVVHAHVDALELVVREQIQGDGGEVGRQMIGALAGAVEKMLG